MSGKHKWIAEMEIELIAKQAENKCTEMMDRFKEMQAIIVRDPEDIEDLTEIKEFMEKVPIELKKMKPDMDQCMEVFGMLDDFNYKWPSDDKFDQKWVLYGSPLDTMVKIQRAEVFLEQQKKKFLQLMISE